MQGFCLQLVGRWVWHCSLFICCAMPTAPSQFTTFSCSPCRGWGILDTSSHSSASVSGLELILLLLGVAVQSNIGVPFCLECVGFSGVIPASFWVTASRIILASWSWQIAGSYRPHFQSELVGLYQSLSQWESCLHPQTHPRPDSSKALQNYSNLVHIPFPFPLLAWLGLEVSYCDRGMKVVRISHGEQAILVGRQYDVQWHDCGHPCQGMD